MIEQILPHLYEAWKIAKHYFHQEYTITDKEDNTPVTQADLHINEFLSTTILSLFPEDQIFSEENIQYVDETKRIWTIDPIDWTKNFIAKQDTFSIIIWCVYNWESIFGWIYFPIQNIVYIAEKWKGAFKIDGDWQHILQNYANIPLDEARLCYKPSITRSTQAKYIVEKTICKSKTELRPTGYIASQVLENNYDLLILAGWYSYELATLDILFKESWYNFSSLENKNIYWQFTTPKITDVVIIGNKNTHKELVKNYFFESLWINQKYRIQANNSRNYFLIDHNFLEKIPDLIHQIKTALQYDNIYILTDNNIYNIYKDWFNTFSLPSNHYIKIQPWEKSKWFHTIKKVTQLLLKNWISKSSLLINIWWWVVGNIWWLVAGLLFRWIDFIHIPTTYLSQSDSFIWGKQGINTDFGKNTIWILKEPLCSFIDTIFLATLPQKEINNGIAETIKHAIIQDKNLLTYFNQTSNNLSIKELDLLVQKSISLKLILTNLNNKYSGIGNIMKYGHEIGHAIEILSQNYLHWEAISIGMGITSFILFQKWLLSKEDFEEQINTLKKWNLPIIRDNTINQQKLIKELSKEGIINQQNIIELISIKKNWNLYENLFNTIRKIHITKKEFEKFLWEYQIKYWN